MSSVSVFLEALDFSNNVDLSNAVPLSDYFLIDSYFSLLDACGLSVSLTVSIFIFTLVMSDGSFYHIIFCFRIINPFFDHLYCSGDQWLIGIHDTGSWSFLIGLIQNQCNFIG